MVARLEQAGYLRREPDPHDRRQHYLGMELTGWFVIIPLSLISLVVGRVQALGTPWGLFRHYLVLLKFLITTLATTLLLVHMRPVTHLARVAAETTLSRVALRGPRIQLVADASAALLALLVATTLSVYKPGGMIAHGRRKHHEQCGGTDRGSTTSTPRWVYVFGIARILLFVIRHLTMLGHGSHGH